jgi:hypothetical protein
MDRRGFLKVALGAGVAGSALLAGPKAVRAMQANRNCFISISTFGGWDTYLGHQAISTSTLGNLPTDTYGALQAGSVFTRRFLDSDIVQVNDPLGGPRFMGPLWTDTGMSTIFNRMAIWRGLVTEAGHQISNTLLHHGSLSSYAASYPALIAQDLAQDYLRPLHYVQVAPSTDALVMGSGLLPTAAMVPTQIPDALTWAALTNAPAAVAASYRRNFVDTAVRNLSSTALTQPLSANGMQSFANFLTAYNGAQKIRGTGYATSPQFAAILASYTAAVTSGLANAKAAGRYPTLTAGAVNVAPYAAMCFNFALAEFLISNDLSAVVALPGITGDNHEFDDSHYQNMCATYSCFRQLVQNLAATQDITRPGQSMLDCTTISMESDFDRTYDCNWLSASNAARPGTNHGLSTSVVFAGAKINAGRIFGDVQTGPAGPYAAIPVPFSGPLPVDPNTGIPNANGTLFMSRALFPTMLALFGIPVPSDQVTDQTAFNPLLKCG